MSNWNDKQHNEDLQTIKEAGDNALQDLYKALDELREAGETQAEEAERLTEQSNGLMRRLFNWLAVAIFIVLSSLSLNVSHAYAQDPTPTPSISTPPTVATPTPDIGEPVQYHLFYLPIVGAVGTNDIVGGCSENCNPTGGNPQGKAPVVNWNSHRVDEANKAAGAWQARGN